MKHAEEIKKLEASILNKNTPEHIKVIFRKKLKALTEGSKSENPVKIDVKVGKEVTPIAKSSIEELDRKFAEKAGISYEDYKNLSDIEQSNLRLEITNKDLAKNNKPASKIKPTTKKTTTKKPSTKTAEKIREGVYKINEKEYDLTELILPFDHPIMMCDHSSTQWANAVEEYFEEIEKKSSSPASKTKAVTKRKKATSKEESQKIIPLDSIKIEWSESNHFKDGQIFKSWDSFQKASDKVVKDLTEEDGYLKTKIVVTWKDGPRLVDRVDFGLSDNDYHGQQSIASFIRDSGPMYGSNIQEGGRSELDWGKSMTPSNKDEKPEQKPKTTKPKSESKTKDAPTKSDKKKIIAEIIASTPAANIKRDKARKALAPGRRISKDGNIYYERRRNRSDVDPKKRI